MTAAPGASPSPAEPGFARVLAAEGVSNFGTLLSRLAVPWLAALVLQATPSQMAALLAAEVLAAAVGSLLLAGAVDRRGKRAVMLACDVLRAALFAGLALAAWAGAVSMALLAVAVACNGLASGAFELARSAWIAQRVPEPALPRSNAQLSAVGSVSETAAFALGGWLYQGLGAALALAADAASFVVSALCLRGVPEAVPVAPPRAHLGSPWRALWAEARSGLALVAAHPGLRALAAIEALLAAGGGLFAIAFTIFVTRDVGYEPGPLGLVYAVGGLGALAGAALAPALGRRLGRGGAMAAGLVLLVAGNACVPLAVIGGAGGLALLVLHQLVGDGGHVVYEVHDRTLRQTLVDAAVLARADAGVRAVGQLATLAAALGGGLLGDALGARATLVVAVGLFALAVLLAVVARPRLVRPPG